MFEYLDGAAVEVRTSETAMLSLGPDAFRYVDVVTGAQTVFFRHAIRSMTITPIPPIAEGETTTP